MISYLLETFIDLHTYLGLVAGVVFAVPLTALYQKAKAKAAPVIANVETSVVADVKKAEADVAAKV